jgi:ornithine carbamoyltransferase
MNKLNSTKEDVLVEALPYIQRYEGKTFVIKYGGAAMTDDDLKESFAKDVVLLRKIGIRIVIVHGGGKAITELSDKLGHTTRFYNGQRYTDEDTLSSVLMTLVGTTNKEVVRLIGRNGGSAIGLSGMDGTLLRASKYLPDGVDLGAVGKIESVNAKLLDLLVSNGSIPVIAPVAIGDDGEIYNVNADLAASAIATALGAEKLFYMTDTDGILIDGELIPTLTDDKAQQFINEGVITGGMLPKVSSAFDALNQGVKKVHIVNGAQKHSLLLEIFTNVGVGTQIIQSEHPEVYPSSDQGKDKEDLIDFSHLDQKRLLQLFRLAEFLEKHPEQKPLEGKSVAILFQKPSLRTRVSFEVGVAQLGGTPVILSDESIGIGKRESTADVAKVLARYSQAIIARVFEHKLIEDLSTYSKVPVINALSDLLHPCQILADAYTLYKKGMFKPGVKIAFIGDGNNVANSWIELAAIYPIDLRIACPKGYEPDNGLFEKAKAAGISSLQICEDPQEAAKDADVLYTDVWTSMGQETEQAERKKIFARYQINRDLLGVASKNAVVMHCLPAHRGEEITDEMITAPQSVIFDEAENRLHIQKAVLAMLIGTSSTGDRQKEALTEQLYEKTNAAISD